MDHQNSPNQLNNNENTRIQELIENYEELTNKVNEHQSAINEFHRILQNGNRNTSPDGS